MPRVSVRVFQELNDHLPKERRGLRAELEPAPGETVKTIVENLGVPHTEIDLITVNGCSVGFGFRPAEGDEINVYPMFERFDISELTRVRSEPLRRPRFELDLHLGKLARLLRMCGIDAEYRPPFDDPSLVDRAVAQRRVLLSRDRELFKHKRLTHGYWVRSLDPERQLHEVIERLDLHRELRPFSRCMSCNGTLEPVAKEDVLERIPQRTARAFHEFKRCPRCDKLYWKGSHYEQMLARLPRSARRVQYAKSVKKVVEMRRIGAHVSAAGGPHKAVERAAAIECNCVQVFSGSPRSWKRKPIEQLDAEKLHEARRRVKIDPVVTHALYLINLASEDAALLENSMQALQYDLAFDAAIGGAGVVVHLGSHQGRGWDAVQEEVLRRVATLVENSPPEATFLIENSAGQKGKLSSDLAEIRWMLDRLSSPQVGWCFDTCHAFAAGYALGDPRNGDPRAGTRGFAVEEIERLALWDELRCVHVNDSRDPFDSGRDRHANINDGEIPSGDLSYFLNRPEIESLPLILEVPGVENDGPDLENVRRLRALVGEA